MSDTRWADNGISWIAVVASLLNVTVWVAITTARPAWESAIVTGFAVLVAFGLTVLKVRGAR